MSVFSLSTLRGADSNYGGPNSTIGAPNDVAAAVGVAGLTSAPKWCWALAWRSHGRLLPLLHLLDACRPPESSQSLKVLWNKALANSNPRSAAFDQYWTLDLLPSPGRWFLRCLPSWLWPRWHHANIEIRTAYLQQALEQCLAQDDSVRLVCVGAGYDARATRLLATHDKVVEAWELDLANVIAAKQAMLQRLQRRRRRGGEIALPQFCAIDLNDAASFADCLTCIVNRDPSLHTIFLFEGVLIYVDDPMKVLTICADAVPQADLVFADRLADVDGGNRSQAVAALERAGWILQEWLPKPGLARHMGIARRCV